MFGNKEVYKLKKANSDKIYEVKGEKISKNFAIHKEKSNEWWIDHLPSGYMLKDMSSKEKAEILAHTIENMMDWNHEDSLDVFRKSEYFRNFFGEVSACIESGDEVPEPPEVLKYNLFFIDNDEIDERWEMFLEAWNEMDGLIGLKEVKKQVMQIMESIRGRKINERLVYDKAPPYHMVFKGSPGTGKTELARVVGKLFYAIGIVPENKFNEVGRKDLVGEHVGETAPKSNKVIKSSMGGVLFIDEAYALAPKTQNDFGYEAIEVLIKAMEDNRQDLVVILAGYDSDMEELLEVNEGFRSRVRFHLHFEDYTIEELKKIAKLKLNGSNCTLTEDAEKELEDYLSSQTKQGVVKGNARAVRNIVDFVMESMHARSAKTGEATNEITGEDIQNSTLSSDDDPKRLEQTREEALKDLHELIGMDELKGEVKRILNKVKIDKRKKDLGLKVDKSRMHMSFAGPPGTGKTTVARVIGKFLKGSGVLSKGQFVEASRAELVAEYLGQTAPKTKKMVNKAKGGVLFIDEAYNLVTDDQDYFGKEAVATLIQEMEDNHEDLVVILAGYKEEIRGLLDTNPGFKSRIGHHFEFPNYNSGDIFEISKIVLEKNGYLFSDEVKEILKSVIEEYAEHFGKFDGNGRWADEFAKAVGQSMNQRVAEEYNIEEVDEVTIRTISVEDVRIAFEKLFKRQKAM